MLYETEFQFVPTTWRWLSTGSILLDPLDHRVAKVVTVVPNAIGGPPEFVGGTLEFTHEPYEVPKEDRAALNGIHAHRLNEAHQHLPSNNQFVTLSDAESQRLEQGSGPDLAVAVMNPKWNDPTAMALPVTMAGATAAAGTRGAATCVAVLARATGTGIERAVACSHLTANDMDSLQKASNSIRTLHQALLGTLATPQHGTAEYFLLGGQTDPDDPDLIEHYARVVAAVQRLAPELSITLAGMRLPASDDEHCVDALITPTKVAFAQRACNA